MDFVSGLVTQKNVIYALIQREAITRYSNTAGGFLWVLAEPAMHLSAYIALFQIVDRESPISGTPTILFLLLALLPFLFFRRATISLGSAIESNIPLLSFRQVRVVDLFIARLVLEFVVYFSVTSITLIIFHFVGWFEGVDHYLDAFFALLTLSSFSLGVGMILAGVKLYLPSFGEIYNNSLRLLYWTAGIFFLIDDLPRSIQDYAVYHPILQYSEWFRSALISNFDSEHISRIFQVKLALISVWLGFIILHLSEGKIREQHD